MPDDEGIDIAAQVADSMNFMVAYQRFKERLVALKLVAREPVPVALLICLVNQFRFLAGVTELVEKRQPAGGCVILRSMYEVMIDALLLGYHKGTIARDGFRDNPRTAEARTISRDKLADRFIAFADYIDNKYVADYMGTAWAKERLKERQEMDPVEFEARREQIAEQAELLRVAHGIKDDAVWWPFRGIQDVRRHLWPEDRSPLFPKELLYDSGGENGHRDWWQHSYDVCYVWSSHYVHGNAASQALRRDPITRHEQVYDDSPYDDPVLLKQAVSVTDVTLHAFVDCLQLDEHWKQSVK